VEKVGRKKDALERKTVGKNWRRRDVSQMQFALESLGSHHVEGSSFEKLPEQGNWGRAYTVKKFEDEKSSADQSSWSKPHGGRRRL